MEFVFLLIVGLVMAVALLPTVIVYFGCATVLKLALKRLEIPFPRISSLVGIVLIGIGASYFLNRPIVQDINNYKNLDLAIEGEVKTPRTIAIYSAYYNKDKGECNVLLPLSIT